MEKRSGNFIAIFCPLPSALFRPLPSALIIRMKAYIYATGIKISPFNDDVGQSRVFNRPLEAMQREALARLGIPAVNVRSLDEVPAGPGLLIYDHVCFSPDVLRKFKAQVEKVGRPAVLALRAGGFTDFTLPIQDAVAETLPDGGAAVRYGVYYFREAPRRAEELAAAERVVVTPDEKKLRIERVERLTEGRERMEYSLTRDYVFHINHWSHILYANLYALYHYWTDASPGRLAWYLGCLLRAHSLNKWKLMAKMVRQGKNCDIHPSAVVEASILGNNVKIGRRASVWGSVLADNVEVDSGADLTTTIVGEDATIASNTRLALTVIYPRACVGQFLMQGFVIGRGVLAAPAGFAMDMKLGRDIVVEHQGRPVSTGKRFLGSCIGHQAVIGAGVWLDSGLEIPNGYHLVRDPDQMVRKVPKGLPTGKPLIVRDGTLIPIHKRRKGPRLDKE